MSNDAPTPPPDGFPQGRAKDMQDILLSPPTGEKLAATPAGPWQPPSAEELQKLLPQYEITALLGRGGMGAVYKGRQIALDRPVAIKILSNTLEEADASFAERFKNEARALGKLSHPGIVGVYDFGEAANGLLYIVMEFIDGTDVAKMLAQQKRLHTEHAMAITAHVCDALAYAHERGIIHRDIKPANIMVGYDGVVKVADFGLAKMTHSQNSGLTQSGMAMGTLHYMAPEALMLGSAVDHRADIYAVGVMLYQMLTGKIPQGLFELPSLQVPGLDPRYDGIIGKALREDRELRYPTVLAMRHDLDAILTQPVVKVEPFAEKAPAALETQARPQRPGGQPYRPPQPEVIVRTEKKGSPLLWVALILMSGITGWLVFNKDSEKRGEESPSAPVSETPAAAPVSPAKVTAGTQFATTSNPAEATKDAPFTNSLGMKFVPVPGTKVLFCIHETRRSDYAKFAAEVPNLDGDWKSQDYNGIPCGDKDDHPVVGVSWEDAVKFCDWVSKKEGATCRLSTDEEWSIAVGLGGKENRLGGATPEMLNGKETSEFPWGGVYPPRTKDRAGNYGDTAWIEKFPNEPGLKEYADGFPTTAPVMSFKPNKLGLYDMGGNVWEWVGDWWNNAKTERVLRGAAFDLVRIPSNLLSSRRLHHKPSNRLNRLGFRCVLEVASQPNLTTKAPVVPTPPQPSQSTNSTVQTSPSTVGDPPNTTKRVIDLLALVDVHRDALFKTAWSQVADGIRTETTDYPRMAFPHSVSAEEYDLEFEFSLAGEPTEVAVWCPTTGRMIKWAMQAMPRSGNPWYGFLQLDGKMAVGSAKEIFVNRPTLTGSSARHTTTIKVRKGSLTGMVDDEVLVSWQGDLTRFTDTSANPSNRNFNYPTVGAVEGNLTIHKATITEFVPQPALPTGPTTWTDTKGRSITATFKALASGNVLLDIAGKVTPVPLNTLSAESQKLARDYHEALKAGAVKATAQPSEIPADAFAFGTSRYSYFAGSISWQEAKSKAESLGGHLVTFNTQAEEAAVLRHFRTHLGPTKLLFWTGGIMDKGDDSWRWTTGEPFKYTHWEPNEPNNTNGKGDQGRGLPPFVIACRHDVNARIGWCDFSTSQADWQRLIDGYIVEWEALSPITSVLTPSSANTAADPAQATKDRPFVNTLGMKFVPVPGTKVLFCIHETRRQDYAAFAEKQTNVGTQWMEAKGENSHAVMNVNWDDAQAFCAWLTQKDGVKHRLPTDREWSFAVGIGHLEKEGASPKNLSEQNNVHFPWGTSWPPPNHFGNYMEGGINRGLPASATEQYTDGYNGISAPVMSYKPNSLGIHDLGGNVWEWCADWYDETQTTRVMRGSSWWGGRDRKTLLSAYRLAATPDMKDFPYFDKGFRCVVELP